jgi:hypothetical protein
LLTDLGQIKPVHRLGEAEVRIDAGDHDPCVDCQEFNPDQRYPHVDVDHDPLVEDHVEHFGQATGAGMALQLTHRLWLHRGYCH